MSTIELMPCMNHTSSSFTAYTQSDNSNTLHRRKRQMRRRRDRRARQLRLAALRLMIICLLTTAGVCAGGIATRAQSKDFPVAYKYYDTITVAYQESLTDIVDRYDDRAHYATREDYVKDLCRINNIPYDGAICPEVSPGTRLIVPYYAQELK